MNVIIVPDEEPQFEQQIVLTLERQENSYGEEDNLEMFVQIDGHESVTIDRDDWIRLGSPETVRVVVSA